MLYDDKDLFREMTSMQAVQHTVTGKELARMIQGEQMGIYYC